MILNALARIIHEGRFLHRFSVFKRRVGEQMKMRRVEGEQSAFRFCVRALPQRRHDTRLPRKIVHYKM